MAVPQCHAMPRLVAEFAMAIYIPGGEKWNIDIHFFFSLERDTDKTLNDTIVERSNPGLNQKYNEICLKFALEELYILTKKN
jgi:hypothetical protein